MTETTWIWLASRWLAQVYLELHGIFTVDPSSPWSTCEQWEGQDHPSPRQEYYHGASLCVAVTVWRGVDQGWGGYEGSDSSGMHILFSISKSFLSHVVLNLRISGSGIASTSPLWQQVKSGTSFLVRRSQLHPFSVSRWLSWRRAPKPRVRLQPFRRTSTCSDTMLVLLT